MFLDKYISGRAGFICSGQAQAGWLAESGVPDKDHGPLPEIDWTRGWTPHKQSIVQFNNHIYLTLGSRIY
jgi:hypothetical protein